MAHHRPPSQFGGGQMMSYGGPPMPPQQTGQKRSRPHDDQLEMGSLGGLHSDELEGMHHGLPQPPMGVFGAPSQHHHHRLPDQGPPSKMMRHGEPGESAMMSQGAPSVVGQPGMPVPAPRPRGPKLKFTPEDDGLLVDLKENKSLTWKQIADFFPGRSSGTLQVRYCTKLKAKTTQWTDETVQKLRNALNDYEQEKWRIVANKVGTGFTPAACREKAQEL